MSLISANERRCEVLHNEWRVYKSSVEYDHRF